MKVFAKILTGILAFLIIAPNAQASISFYNEYETMERTLYYGSNNTGGLLFDVLDYDRINNWNNTILPLMEENESFRGICQYSIPFPEIIQINRTAGAPSAWGENSTFAWYYRPDPKSIFDGHSEAWLRLPINNLTLGPSATHEIRLAIWKPYVDSYNISLGDTIDNTSLSAGEYGDTPGEKIYDDYIYTSRSLTSLGYTAGNLGTNYIHQDARTASWNATLNNTIIPQSIDYNFTYIKVTTPLYRGVGYVFVLQLTTRGASAPEYQMLWTDGDMNNDFIYKSHLNLSEYGQVDIDFDYDVPIIATDLTSGPYYSVGFSNVTEETRYVFEYFVNDTYDPTKTVTAVIPFFSSSSGSLNATIGISSNMTSSYTVSSVYTIEIQPGYNTIIVNHSFPVTSVLERVYVSLLLSQNLAENVSFILSQTEGIGGRTTVRHSNSPYQHLYRTNAVSICRLLVSTSTIGYVPLDKVFVVPDPANLTASKQYVDYANQLYHAIQQGRIRFVDEDNNVNEIIITITIIGLVVVATALVIAGAPVVIAVGVTALALAWIFRDDLANAANDAKKKIDNLLDKVISFFGTAIKSFSKFIWKVVVFLYHSLSWIVTNAMQLLALWCVLTVYLLAVYAANGVCSAVTKSRRERKRGYIFNVETFDRVIMETYEKYVKLVMFNMSLIGALFVILSIVLKMVVPI